MGWYTDAPTLYASTSWKGTAFLLQRLSRAGVKISPTLRWNTSIDLWAVAKRLSGQGFRKNKIGRVVWRRSGRVIWMVFSEGTYSVKILRPCGSPPEGIHVEDALSNQGNRMTTAVDVRQPFSRCPGACLLSSLTK